MAVGTKQPTRFVSILARGSRQTRREHSIFLVSKARRGGRFCRAMQPAMRGWAGGDGGRPLRHAVPGAAVVQQCVLTCPELAEFSRRI
jgi:hypothetical protein